MSIVDISMKQGREKELAFIANSLSVGGVFVNMHSDLWEVTGDNDIEAQFS